MNLPQAQDKVAEFMFLAKQEIPTKPIIPKIEVQILRLNLMLEELAEYASAQTVEEVADGLADFLYVVLGTAVAYGQRIYMIQRQSDLNGPPSIPSVEAQLGCVNELTTRLADFARTKEVYEMDLLIVAVLGVASCYNILLEPIFNEVHRSNMTKFIDGYVREDGKYVKGPSYSRPDINRVLSQQYAHSGGPDNALNSAS